MRLSLLLLLLVGCGFGAGILGFDIEKGTLVETGFFLAGLLLEALLAVFWLSRGVSRIAMATKTCIITGIWGVSWGFFGYFNALPGRFAWQYLFAEPQDSWNLVVSYWEFSSLLLWLGVTALLFSLIQLLQVRFPVSNGHKIFIPTVLVGLILFGVVLSGFRTNPGKGSPGFDLGLSLIQSTYEAAMSPPNKLIRLQPRVITPLVQSKGEKMPFPILLIVHESLRKENMSLYSYKKETTPSLKKWIRAMEAHSHEVYQFENAYSNATFTHLSYPSLLSGVHPIEGMRALHTRPLLFEIIRSSFRDVRTAIVSTHSYATGNYAAYLSSTQLDHLIYRETEGWQIWNNMGADDSHLPAAFAKVLDAMGTQSFFAVVHHNGTHFPYKTADSSESNLRLQYDKAIQHVDGVMDQYFTLLSDRGLLDRTLIIMTSDHGESFGENGTNGHFGPIHPSNSLIPFLWLVPKTLAMSSVMQRNLKKPVSNIDIVPTVLTMLGLSHENYRGRDLYHSALKDGDDVLIYNLGTGQSVLHFAVASETQLYSYVYQLGSANLQHKPITLNSAEGEDKDFKWEKVDCDARHTGDPSLLRACELSRCADLNAGAC